MPRPLRFQGAGIRHITARGNRRQRIFLDPWDREWYLAELDDVCRTLEWRVLSWCLMTNHVHLVADVPAGTISDGMQQLSGKYAAGFNARHGYSGHLFQGRFRAEVVADVGYAVELARYVDLNPVRAGAVSRAADWAWSSYRALAGLARPRPFHDADRTIRRFGTDLSLARAAYVDFVAAGAKEHRRRVRLRHDRGLTPVMAVRGG